MPAIVLNIALRIALCSLVTWLVYRKLELVALPICAPLFGVALARPIIDFFAEAHHAGRRAALEDLQGRYWAHRGQRLDIAEDADDARWLLLADVRKVLPGLPRDEVMQVQFGERTAVIEPSPGLRIRADALADYLRKSTDTASLKFKNWLDHEVMLGSKNPRIR